MSFPRSHAQSVQTNLAFRKLTNWLTIKTSKILPQVQRIPADAVFVFSPSKHDERLKALRSKVTKQGNKSDTTFLHVANDTAIDMRTGDKLFVDARLLEKVYGIKDRQFATVQANMQTRKAASSDRIEAYLN